jgi:hypothetical protein
LVVLIAERDELRELFAARVEVKDDSFCTPSWTLLLPADGTVSSSSDASEGRVSEATTRSLLLFCLPCENLEANKKKIGKDRRGH